MVDSVKSKFTVSRMLENRILMRIFGRKKEEVVKVECKNCIICVLHQIFLSPCLNTTKDLLVSGGNTPSFLSSALNGNEWLVSRCGHINLQEDGSAETVQCLVLHVHQT
jgi:hypothetical protein